MPEDHQQQESNDQTQEGISEPTPSDHTTGLTDVNDSMQVKDADVPWDVVQAQECLPADEKAVGFFMFNGNPVLVCGKGMYGKHEGSFQRLPVKVLVDNL